LEEPRDAALEKPEGPAVAEIDNCHRHHSLCEPLPGNAHFRSLALCRQCSNLFGRDGSVPLRFVSEVDSPYDGPKETCDTDDDEGRAQRNGHDQGSDQPWSDRAAESGEGVCDSLSVTPLRFRQPVRHRSSGRWEGRALTKSKNESGNTHHDDTVNQA